MLLLIACVSVCKCLYMSVHMLFLIEIKLHLIASTCTCTCTHEFVHVHMYLDNAYSSLILLLHLYSHEDHLERYIQQLESQVNLKLTTHHSTIPPTSNHM